MTCVLIVDDDPEILAATSDAARRAGFEPVTAAGGNAALARLRSDPSIAAVVLDLVMPDCDGMAVLATVARERLEAPVVVTAAAPDLELVTTLLRHGAADVVGKPVTAERLLPALRTALLSRARHDALQAERHRRDGALGAADIVRVPAVDRGLAVAARAGRNPAPVLIEGEAGTGKHLLAHVIHGSGDRAGRPLHTRHCATTPRAGIDRALTADLLAAHGGTLLLGEVGILPGETQQILLRFIETGEVAGSGPRPGRPNVRLVATSRMRLLDLAKAGLLREDLYYRLNVLPIYLPPLRQRREEIAALAAFFAGRFAAELGRAVPDISGEALAMLREHDWPGNVRELESAVYRAVVLSEGGRLDVADFPQLVAAQRGRAALARLTESLPRPSAPVQVDLAIHQLKQTEGPAGADRFLTGEGEVTPLARLERELIEFALRRHGGRMSRVARALGIGRSTLYRKLREFGLESAIVAEAAE